MAPSDAVPFSAKECVYWLSLCGFALVLYVGVVAPYRLFLSPLAKFPGPRLAAATSLYEIYFQIVKDGKFTWHINDLHDKYGPVVRIKPNEVHIKDPEYYNTLYAGPGKHRNKDSGFSFITYPQSLFSTNGYELHRMRRRVLGHFFKKKAVLEMEPLIQANVHALCRHFSNGLQNQKPLELHTAYECFASDTLSQYAFGQQHGFHYLDQPTLSITWKSRITSMFSLCRLVRYFPALSAIARLSKPIATLASPSYKHVHEFEQDVRQQVRNVIKEHKKTTSNRPAALPIERLGSIKLPTPIYYAVLADPTIPDSEKKSARLEDDALFLMMAGTDAPAQTLAITMFHILNTPSVYQKIKAELFSAIPDITTAPSFALLNSLPYLSATIREGLRLSSVVTTRLPRIAPDEVLQYQRWQIPAGTPVSMSTYFILRDPTIFPEPTKFIPERWLLDTEDLKRLQRYLLPASKGTLGCLGQNLNWAWMNIVIGTLLRRFDLVLYDTTERNVEMTKDNFIGQTEDGALEDEFNYE
ncbi:hypothetical protein N7532_002309 [Penicillium argentinense]|uniref:Uncharacterized protein n=1 Tax=Penicillium argentinense TaxID=1131581 RepID=A0A9W9KK59_9EURO|nr:uncharacterized protein N7532_002309 [Penicillium argentinense]KAJ5109664.1 hypothetical protein N7532_002309 [Penicillium argentinense]